MSIQDMFDNCETYCEPNPGAYFRWSKKGRGFGELSFYFKDDKLMCGNELMSKEFIKKMLCLMVDECELDCPRSTPEPEWIDEEK
jgi:hypothetical protein